MKTVRHLLQAKGHDVWSVSPEISVYDALTLMVEQRVGAVMVCDSDRLIGIFTERDHAQKVAVPELPARETTVGSVMTERVLYVRPEQDIGECMALMTDKQVRHLPVLEDNRVVGVISIRDVIKEVIAEREFMIEQLENYITDRWA